MFLGMPCIEGAKIAKVVLIEGNIRLPDKKEMSYLQKVANIAYHSKQNAILIYKYLNYN